MCVCVCVCARQRRGGGGGGASSFLNDCLFLLCVALLCLHPALEKARKAERKAAAATREADSAHKALENKDSALRKLRTTARVKQVKLKHNILENVEMIQNMFEVRVSAVVQASLGDATVWLCLSWPSPWGCVFEQPRCVSPD